MGSDPILFQEIQEQPDVIARFWQDGQGALDELVAGMRVADIRQIVIAARGTSDNAARYAQYLLGANNRLPVMLTTPSLFTLYQRPPLFAPGTLVLGISQSGQSPDIVSVLAEGKRQGHMTAAITNSEASPLAQQADQVVALRAGRERSIAATKTYTAQLFAVGLLSAHLAGDADRIETLQQAPSLMRQTLAMNGDVERLAERYRYMRNCVVVGRGYNYSTTFEIALKLKELTYTLAEPYSSADFLHGPVSLIEPGFSAIVVASSGILAPEMRALVEQLRGLRAELLCVSSDEAILETGRSRFPFPPVPDWLSPLLAVVPGQLLAFYLALARDFDPDHPRGLSKITETR
ncbi:MAG: SIS domain-containing protein [Caldilineaceae bacterium]|nr:SIS domain-containing protein [Caldilineaceae bacterium]